MWQTHGRIKVTNVNCFWQGASPFLLVVFYWTLHWFWLTLKTDHTFVWVHLNSLLVVDFQLSSLLYFYMNLELLGWFLASDCLCLMSIFTLFHPGVRHHTCHFFPVVKKSIKTVVATCSVVHTLLGLGKTNHYTNPYILNLYLYMHKYLYSAGLWTNSLAASAFAGELGFGLSSRDWMLNWGLSSIVNLSDCESCREVNFFGNYNQHYL